MRLFQITANSARKLSNHAAINFEIFSLSPSPALFSTYEFSLSIPRPLLIIRDMPERTSEMNYPPSARQPRVLHLYFALFFFFLPHERNESEASSGRSSLWILFAERGMRCIRDKGTAPTVLYWTISGESTEKL